MCIWRMKTINCVFVSVNTKYTLRVFIDKLRMKTITCIFVSSVLVYLCVCICTCRVFIDLLRMKTIGYIFVFVYLCICVFVYLCICVFVYLYLCICIWVFVFVDSNSSATHLIFEYRTFVRQHHMSSISAGVWTWLNLAEK